MTETSTADRFGALSQEKTRLLRLLLEQKAQQARQLKRLPRSERSATEFPISGAQQRLWFLDQLEGASAAYHVPLVFRVRGRLDLEALRDALNALVARHEVFRTTFLERDGEVLQSIATAGEFPLELIDVADSGDSEHEAWQRAREQIGAPFDLRKGPLVRGSVIRLTAEDSLVVFATHHIISDGWSIGIFVQELEALYTARVEGSTCSLPELTVQYADYVQCQRVLQETQPQEQLGYWREHLTGAPDLLELPTDRPRPATQSFRGAVIDIEIEPALTAALKTCARRFNTTLAMTVQTAWTVLLSKLSGQEDLVIGIPISNRRRSELEGLIGFFVDTLAVRLRLDAEATLSDLLLRVKETMLGAYANQDVPLELVVQMLQPVRSLSHSPVVQVTFAWQPPQPRALQLSSARVEVHPLPSPTAQFDLSLALAERDERICGYLNFATDLFDHETVVRWSGYLKRVLEALVQEPRRPFSRVSLLSSQERRMIVEHFNPSPVPFPAEQLLTELFEEQVARTPTATAIVHAGRALTFEELNNRANLLAERLLEAGIGVNALVGICADRSIDLVIGVLGILKVGGAYVPLDPSYPSSRLQYMLRDSAPQLLVTQPHLRDRLQDIASKVIVLDDRELPRANIANIDTRGRGVRAHHRAYVIYTSGSTGQPKGVVIEHRNVVNLWRGLENLYGARPRCRNVALNASFNFDASVQQWVQLLSGRALYIVPQECRQDATLMLEFITRHAIDGIDCTPSQLRAWIAAGLLTQPRLPLQVVLVGGEALDALLWQTLAACRDIDFHNVYGPTECTVDATSAQLNGDTSMAHIGRPMDNRRIYILDRYGEPVPIGMVGEIHIGGEGVGEGYLNRPQLTAERFVADTLHELPGARRYRTGDFGRWRADGTIEYLGRNDLQVKIRGYRIELGEIDAHLGTHVGLCDVATVVREDVAGDKRIVSYVVARDPNLTPTAEDLRAHLKKTLPEYMVPSSFVRLDRLPLTLSGKVDRRALPAPDVSAYAGTEYQAPQGEIEEILAAAWESLLRVPRVGRQDNFFELGGHSLLLMQLKDQLRRVGLVLHVRDVFDEPTLAGLARKLSGVAKDSDAVPANLIPAGCERITPEMLPLVRLDATDIERIAAAVPGGMLNIQDIYPLVPLQEGILFHHLLDREAGDAYVLPVVLVIENRARLADLAAGLQAAVDRHEVLRTSVHWEDLPRPVQVVHRRAALTLEEVTFRHDLDIMEQIRNWLAPERQTLDLRKAPLIRLQAAADPHSERWYVLLQTHHITSDHVSFASVIEEVVAHLEHRDSAPLTSMPYRNHVARTLAAGAVHDSEAFFRRKLADVEEPTAPFGLLNVHGDGTTIAEAYEDLDTELARQVRVQARRHGVSPATLFHAAWGLVVARTSGRDDVVFGSVLIGRLLASEDARGSLGLFINMLPLRLQLHELTARSLIEATARELVELLSHEQASLAVAQRCSGIAGSAPLFTSLLNYRHSSADPTTGWSAAQGIEVVAIQERSNYPIALSVDDLGDGFSVKAQTDRRIDPQRINACLRTAIAALVEALAQHSDEPVLQLEVIPEAEREKIIRSFNATATSYPRDALTHELFEAWAERTPDAAAVSCAGRTVTYAQLNARANQLARYLVIHGVRHDDYVPVLLPRSLQLLVAQIALQKCGAVYVPVDPELPAERRAFIARDCGARYILGVREAVLEICGEGSEWIDCDGEAAAASIAAQSVENLEMALPRPRPAYVMYTSGSTGVPKGVVVPHHAVNRLAINNGYAVLTDADRIVHHSNPAFDASTFEVWGALLNGGCVIVIPQALVLEAELFAAELLQQKATAMYLSVGLFNQYASSLAEVFRRLRYLLVGGDILEPATVSRVLRDSPPQHFLNVYGPTECTTFSTYHPIESPPATVGSIPIGRPMANAQIYVLNQRRQVVPIGVAGEIYIGGDGVACGYFNREQLTKERFASDPFAGDTTARLYRTGDLGSWRADGVLDFFGRNDHQVKVRGYRIELGEIETRLAQHEHIQETVVLARADGPGEKRLVAYVVPSNPSAAPSTESLREHLKASLPEYMVPGAFVTLESLPLTSTGKVNRKALPAPALDAYFTRQFEEPQGEVEEILAGLWQSLLGVDRVGRHDSFFELGGHSLLIVQLMERLRRLGLVAEVRKVLENPTLCEFAALLSRRSAPSFEVPQNGIPPGCDAITPSMLTLLTLAPEHIAAIERAVPGGAANIQDIYPLAPLQEGILFHHRWQEMAGDVYVLPTLFSFASRERLEQFVDALQTVIDRHDALRTAVLWEQLPMPVQVVCRHAQLPVEQVVLATGRAAQTQVTEWLRPESQRLDLRHAPQMRLRIAADPAGSRWFAMLQLHHIVADGQSLQIVSSEVAALLRGDSRPLPEPVPYRNHIVQALAYARNGSSEEYFRNKLGDVEEPTAPYGLMDVYSDGSEMVEAREALPAELSQRIRAQARRFGVSSATFFHSAWALTAAAASGRDDVVFGTVLLGRLLGSAGAQRILGLFINTLPLRIQLERLSARELVEHTQRELIGLLSHEQAPLAMAQRCSGVAGDTALFTSLLNYRHGSGSEVPGGWRQIEGIDVLAERAGTNYALTISIDDVPPGFWVEARTDQRVAPQRIVNSIKQALQSLVSALENGSLGPALTLPVLPADERHEVVSTFNATSAEYRRDQLIHQLVEEQALRTPHREAVRFGSDSLTYIQLEQRVRRLSTHLQSLGAQPGELVGICLERGLDLIVGVLGALKAGAAYLPLDPSYPVERLQYMLEDANPAAVLTQEPLRKKLPGCKTALLIIDGDEIYSTGREKQSAIAVRPATALDGVYVIYTSGSTGRPKGIHMGHGAMVNLIEWHRRTLPAEGVRVLQFAALSFDVAFQEVFSTLATGGTLVLLAESVRRDPRALVRLINSERIERLFVPPLMLQSIAEYFRSSGELPATLRDVITAGEQLRISPEIVGLFKQLSQCRLHNHYGPTETHVVTALTLTGDPQQWTPQPSIGRPIANTQIYILDRRGQPVPRGVTGEIFIGGDNLAQGYRGRPALTCQRFVANPFAADVTSRMYKTGDVGRWQPDGTIDYLGRNDDQVKLRGFRIELAEIEAQLALHEGVKEVAVVIHTDARGERRLVAYITRRVPLMSNVDDMRAHLKLTLPDYMVPAAIVVLDSMPVTPSGKLNRRVLPAPELTDYELERYEAPQGATEAALAEIWGQLLNNPRVGRHDNFFQLGGHSLHGMRIVAQVEARFSTQLSVASVFKYPTIEKMAAFVDSLCAESASADVVFEEGSV